MNIALYFGSFNPIHMGHIAIAEYIVANHFADEVWFVVSPHNPLKDTVGLAGEQSRFEMAELAVANSKFRDRFKVSDFEFNLPKPSYTVDSLDWLKGQFTTFNFQIVIGEDNLSIFRKWRDWQKILDENRLLVYPREGCEESDLLHHKNVKMLEDVTTYDISSTQIRSAILDDCKIDAIDQDVLSYIVRNNIYRYNSVRENWD